jgi:peptide/nickel transport system substrate-binding protein
MALFARRPFALSLIFAASLSLLACAGDTGSDDGANGAGETPVRGGTLELIGNSDVDHLSTSSAYYSVTNIVLKAFTRQLVTFSPEPTFEAQKELAPDLAKELPTRENGGISADGRTYTFNLRTDVMWDTEPARAVTAGDMVRGFKMLCNPVSPVGAPGYYRDTILGMSEWCDRFAQVAGTVPAIEEFVSGNEITGVQAPNDSTFVVQLIEPAADFLYLVLMNFCSPQPVEYLEYLPDGPEFRANTISNGPYRITSYVPAREMHLGRNPAWIPESDPLRPAYVDSMRIVMGIAAQSVQQQLEAGSADISWDQAPPTADVARLIAGADPNLVIGPEGENYIVMLYMPINVRSNNQNGAFKKLEVRQALQYAIDKVAVVQVNGGPQIAVPAPQAVVSTAAGYRPGFDPYATPESRGDSVRARQLLASAGYPNGLPIKLLYRTGGIQPLIAQTVQASLTSAGFQVEMIPSTGSDFYANYLQNPENAQRGVWDIAVAGWFPDWYGNNGRTVIEALFDGRNIGPNSVNYGGYNNPEVNGLIDQALAAATEQESYDFWSQAATRIIEDAGMVPLVQYKQVTYHSSRVRNCIFSLLSLNCDVTQLWLAGATAAATP